MKTIKKIKYDSNRNLKSCFSYISESSFIFFSLYKITEKNGITVNPIEIIKITNAISTSIESNVRFFSNIKL